MTTNISQMLTKAMNTIEWFFIIFVVIFGAYLIFMLILCCFGFACGGVRKGSRGASFMSKTAKKSGGGVLQGTCVAISQSIGARGFKPKVLLGVMILSGIMSAMVVVGSKLEDIELKWKEWMKFIDDARTLFGLKE